MGNSDSVTSKHREEYKELKPIAQTAVTAVVLVGRTGTSQQYAMKRIKKPNEEGDKIWKSEVGIMKQLKHSHIIEFVDAFEDDKGWNIVSGFMSGGDLFDRIIRMGKFSERQAAVLIKQMVSAVAHIHAKGVVHRDLKPENFVFDTPAEDSAIRLIDFGCARQLTKGDSEVLLDAVGSPYYLAPYLVLQEWRDKRSGTIWKSADMWSMGVIAYVLLIGYPPFNARDQHDIFEKVRKGVFKFPTPKEGEAGVSDLAKDFINHLITIDPTKQLTAAKALEHEWLTGKAADTPLPRTVVDSITAFARLSKLRRVVARVMRNQLIDADKDELNGLFKKYDKNGDGVLSVDEIVVMMKDWGHAESDAKHMMDVFDTNKDGVMTKDEFVGGTALQKLGSQSTEELAKTFKQFDLNGDGFVTASELEKLYRMDKDSLKQVIQEVDTNGDGKISAEEWIAAMKGIPLKSLK